MQYDYLELDPHTNRKRISGGKNQITTTKENQMNLYKIWSSVNCKNVPMILY